MRAARWLRIAAVAALGLGAGAGDWLEHRRPADPESRPATGEIEVTSGADSGRGSLREALFAAAAADRPVRIVVRARVKLGSPLPPVVHAAGLVLEGRALARIDGENLPAVPTLDLRSPGTVVRGLRIVGAELGIQVGAADVELRGVRVEGCDVGIRADSEAHGLLLADATLDDNRLGVLLPADPRRVRLEGNRFTGHREAAVRAVAAAPVAGLGPDDLVVVGNSFDGDDMSVVLANVAARVEDNDVTGARQVAVYLEGAGAEVRRNRIRDGALHGIHAHETRDAVVAGNELVGNGAVAVLVRSGLGTRVEGNHARRNGYGIATVFGTAGRPVVVEDNRLEGHRFDGLYVVGGAPLLRRNRAVDNRGTGLRLLDYVPASGPRLAAEPRLEGNVLEGNGLGPRLGGDYRERG